MGPLFVMLFWAILLTPIAILLGVMLSFVAPFIYYQVRSTPLEKRRRGVPFRSVIAVGFTVLFVPSTCIFLLFLSFAGSDDYWNYRGAFDYWRMPLEPPYELVMIDVPDDASIQKWDNSDGPAIIWDIVKYEKRGSLIAGFCEDDRGLRQPAWFLFDCQTGTVSTFVDEQSLNNACTQDGFPLPLAMRSIRENWDSYWKDPNRRKK
ncbi:MAG: hypothetical protein ABFE01_14905 [Phycisphaerales bacterium]